MLPYLIAGAIGFGIGKLFENGGETFMTGGQVKEEWKSYLKESRVDALVKAGYSKNVAKNLSSESWDSLEKQVQNAFKNVLISEELQSMKGMMESLYTYGGLDKDNRYLEKYKISLGNKLFNKTFDEYRKELVEGYDVDYGTYTDSEGLTYSSLRKKYEGGGETFMAGGRITTNEDVLNSFLTSTKEVKVNNLSTHFNEYENLLLLRNYYTLIATRKGNDVKITNVKHSKTTSAITNRLKALAEEMGYNVSYVSKFENGGEMFMAGGKADSWSVSDLSNAKYLGIIEFQDNEGEYHNFEIMETDDRLVFGGMTNTGFIESGYIEKDGFSTDETLQSLIEDLEVYYNDGAEYTSQIVFNERMENGGEAGGGLPKKRRRSASVQYGRSDTSFDKQLTAKPVGYRFTNAKANQLRKDPYDKPTEAQVKKYLGKGIYKENRKNRSDKNRNAKL